MKTRCVPVTATLSTRGEDGLTGRQRDHIDGCFACRSELSAHRAIAEGMHRLRSETFHAPAEVVPGVMDRIGPWAVPEHGDESERNLHLVAAAAVATAATAAAAGTAVLVRLYRHRAA